MLTWFATVGEGVPIRAAGLFEGIGQDGQVAAGIYDDRSFEELPILGDALIEAGCPDEEMVRHCYQPDVHGRGCWVVDLILSKDR